MGPQPLRPHLPSQSHCLLSQICKLACKLCEDSIELLCCCVSPPFPMVWELLLIKQAAAGFNASREICQPSRNATLYDIDTPILSQVGISNIFNNWEGNYCQFVGGPQLPLHLAALVHSFSWKQQVTICYFLADCQREWSSGWSELIGGA